MMMTVNKCDSSRENAAAWRSCRAPKAAAWRLAPRLLIFRLPGWPAGVPRSQAGGGSAAAGCQ